MKYVRNIFNICDNNIFQIKNFCGIILVEHLVDSTVGALCELNTTKPGVEITDKNPTPTIEKKVQEDSDENWGDVNDADIGQTVNFKSTVSAKPGARKYVVHDKMVSQLEFVRVTSITAGRSCQG